MQASDVTTDDDAETSSATIKGRRPDAMNDAQIRDFAIQLFRENIAPLPPDARDTFITQFDLLTAYTETTGHD